MFKKMINKIVEEISSSEKTSFKNVSNFKEEKEVQIFINNKLFETLPKEQFEFVKYILIKKGVIV